MDFSVAMNCLLYQKLNALGVAHRILMNLAADYLLIGCQNLYLKVAARFITLLHN